MGEGEEEEDGEALGVFSLKRTDRAGVHGLFFLDGAACTKNTAKLENSKRKK